MVNYIVDKIIKGTMIIKREMVDRTCPICQITSCIRKDGVGKVCRSCRAKINQKNKKPKDILGEKFGRLTPIECIWPPRKVFYWLCKCDCGNKVEISGSRLRNGHTKSCGCITATQKMLSKTGAYRTWRAMMQRCYDPKSGSYKRYGGNGIKIHESWHKFENFYNDMGERPEGLTIDRIDSTGNYDPSNCRWATNKEQGSNRSDNHIIEAFGKRMTLKEWEIESGILAPTIRKRIIDLNWDAEKALSLKPRRQGAGWKKTN